MDDLISRQAAIDALNKIKIYRPLDSDRYVISDCLNKIVQLPSAEPERKKGKWISGKYRITCNQCRYTYPNKVGLEDSNFCPNCGADMRGEENEYAL